MATEHGTKIGIAFNAVRQCHKDVGRLISDLDGFMTREGMKRLGTQDSVTSGMSRAAYSEYWMARQLYRLYFDDKKSSKYVEGINIRFFSEDDSLIEPRLIVGRIVYDYPEPLTLQDTVYRWPWDLDDGYHKWCKATEGDLGNPVSGGELDAGRIRWMCAVALDLYAIKSLDDVTSALKQVRLKAEEQNND